MVVHARYAGSLLGLLMLGSSLPSATAIVEGAEGPSEARLVTVDDGLPTGYGASSGGNTSYGAAHPVVSNDGRYVLHVSADCEALYRRDMATGEKQVVEVDYGDAPCHHNPRGYTMSADGRFAAFTDWREGVATLRDDIETYVHDFESGDTERIQLSVPGHLVGGERWADRGPWSAPEDLVQATFHPQLSADGQYLTVEAPLARSLGDGRVEHLDFHILRLDRATGDTVVVSEALDPRSTHNTRRGRYWLSADGQRIVRLQWDSHHDGPHLYAWEASTQASERISMTSVRLVNAGPRVSPDGTQVIYTADQSGTVIHYDARDGSSTALPSAGYHAVADPRDGEPTIGFIGFLPADHESGIVDSDSSAVVAHRLGTSDYKLLAENWSGPASGFWLMDVTGDARVVLTSNGMPVDDEHEGAGPQLWLLPFDTDGWPAPGPPEDPDVADRLERWQDVIRVRAHQLLMLDDARYERSMAALEQWVAELDTTDAPPTWDELAGMEQFLVLAEAVRSTRHATENIAALIELSTDETFDEALSLVGTAALSELHEIVGRESADLQRVIASNEEMAAALMFHVGGRGLENSLEELVDAILNREVGDTLAATSYAAADQILVEALTGARDFSADELANRSQIDAVTRRLRTSFYQDNDLLAQLLGDLGIAGAYALGGPHTNEWGKLAVDVASYKVPPIRVAVSTAGTVRSITLAPGYAAAGNLGVQMLADAPERWRREGERLHLLSADYAPSTAAASQPQAWDWPDHVAAAGRLTEDLLPQVHLVSVVGGADLVIETSHGDLDSSAPQTGVRNGLYAGDEQTIFFLHGVDMGDVQVRPHTSGTFEITIARSGQPLVTGNVQSTDGAAFTVDERDLQADVPRDTSCDEVPPAEFDDVTEANTHYAGISCAVARDIAVGTSIHPPLFSPTRPVTRAQMATFVAQALEAAGYDLPKGPEQRFGDVPPGHTHYANINRLTAAGVVHGKSDGSFVPNDHVQRDQTATFLVQARESATDDVIESANPPFTDVTGNTHEANIAAAAELGLVLGRTDGSYGPFDETRRDQMATVVTRLLTSLPPP